jgi:hypothetical protein
MTGMPHRTSPEGVSATAAFTALYTSARIFFCPLGDCRYCSRSESTLANDVHAYSASFSRHSVRGFGVRYVRGRVMGYDRAMGGRRSVPPTWVAGAGVRRTLEQPARHEEALQGRLPAVEAVPVVVEGRHLAPCRLVEYDRLSVWGARVPLMV